MKQSTGLTVCCPECGTYGFRFLRSDNSGIVDVKVGTERLQRHVPLNYAMSGIKMVCPNPKCGYIHDQR